MLFVVNATVVVSSALFCFKCCNNKVMGVDKVVNSSDDFENIE